MRETVGFCWRWFLGMKMLLQIATKIELEHASLDTRDR